MNLFSQKGFEGTSVREIASAAGVNIAMINYYFVSKEKLFESVVEYKTSATRTMFAELDSNTALSPIEKVDKIIDRYVERMFAAPKFSHLLHRELSLSHRPKLHHAITEILLQNIFTIKTFLQKNIEKGVFKKVDTELTVCTIIGTISNILVSEEMCRKMLRKNKDFNPYQSKKLKERISEHLKQLMRSHLLKTNKTFKQ